MGLSALTMLWQAPARAQDTTRTPAQLLADSLRRDSVMARMRADSTERENIRLRAERRRADSIKTPLTTAEMPVLTSLGPSYQWDREPLFASGALTLGELADFVPGATVYRTGWIGSPHATSYLGAFRKVRVFYEGLEIDPLDSRTGRILDLSFIDTWQLEHARIEQGADELRIHLASWRVRSTTPATRVDFNTGDLETNSYRGYYGRRLTTGHSLQLGVYQYSTGDERNGGDVHQLSLWARAGWSKKKWSVDASLLSNNRERLGQVRLGDRDSLPKLDATMSTAYARVAYGDPVAGVWLQATAARQKLTLHVAQFRVIDSITDPLNPDTSLVSDSADSRPQYVLTGGVTRGPLRLSAVGRLRSVAGTIEVAPGLRAAFENPRLTLSAFVERAPTDSVMRGELSGRLMLLPGLALGASVGRTASIEGSGGPASLAGRLEIGARVGGLWVTGGVMARDTALVAPPIVFDTAFRAAAQGPTRAVFATVRGKFWQDVGLDAWAVRYDAAAAYRPQYQTRSQLYFDSGLLRRFPTGNLHILAAVTHEYRSYAFFPISDTEVLRSSQYRTWGLLLEIRLLAATLTYQFRNFFLEDYAQVPGFAMPRPVNFYGIRWNFFN